MRLILFRHGIAEPQRPGLPDADRALTPRGIKRTTAAAAGLARFIARPQAILTSPKSRAKQTAAILGEAFDLTPQVAPTLAAESPAVILRMLRGRSEPCVLIVGHEPSLSGVVAEVCGGRVELKKAGAAMIEAPLRRSDTDGPATLQWLLPPRSLRMLARD